MSLRSLSEHPDRSPGRDLSKSRSIDMDVWSNVNYSNEDAMLKPTQKLAILFDDQLGLDNGKMGHGVLRYSPNPITCVIDTRYPGKNLHDVIDFGDDCPIVTNVRQAIDLGSDVIVLGMAPSGGRLPEHLFSEMDIAIEHGLCIINGLHSFLNPRYPSLKPDQWVWDIRKEPEGLEVATAKAARLNNKRVLLVGTDMAIGKMTVGLELNKLALERSINSDFLATGQIGITISGKGVPLDAIRVDYAGGAIEQMVMQAQDKDLAFVEGQGSLVHPGSTSTLPLIRGSCPTHLILCHRAGAEHLRMDGGFKIPPLNELINLYEDVSSVCGTFNRAKTVGVALNTYALDDEQARKEIDSVSSLTGLPTTDVVRFGADLLLDALLS